MQTSTQPIEGNDGAQAGEVLLRQMTLSRARELAKKEDYEAALVLLLQMEPTAAALDLRARIEVQRGRYDDARALWKEVLEEAPDHAGAKKGLRDVERAAVLGTVLRGAVLGAVALGLAAVAFVVLRPNDDAKPVRAHVQAAARPQPAAAVEQAAPAPKPIAPEAAAPAPAAAAVDAPAALPATAPSLPQIALPEGVTLRLEDGSQIYSFDGGLFSEGVAFAPGGRERVTAVGRALAPHSGSLQIELIGYVDTMPAPVEKRFHRNTELALSRANAVLGRIARTTRIPADAVALRAVGGRLGPYADQNGDPRNRTVDVRVRLRAQR